MKLYQFETLCLSICLSLTSPAFAAEANTKTNQDLVKYLIENVRTRDHVIALLNNAKVSVESMRVIESDLKKRIPAGVTLPKMILNGNQVYANGKPTGLQILSYSPVKLAFHGTEWRYNPEKLQDESYLSLIAFLEAKPHTVSLIDLLLPRAEALDMLTGVLGGGLVGALAGTFLGGSQSDTLLATVGGAAFGGLLSYATTPQVPRYYPMPMPYYNQYPQPAYTAAPAFLPYPYAGGAGSVW